MKFGISAVALLLILMTYQNCGDVKFDSAKSSSSEGGQGQSGSETGGSATGGTTAGGTTTGGTTGNNEPPDNPEDPGLDGGHFDLDTASQWYAFDQGTTDKHEHEYDDSYNVNYVDFFNMFGGFTTIPSRVLAGQEFIIVVGNASLSPAVRLEINGNLHSVVDYQNQSLAQGVGQMPRFTLSGNNALLNFKLRFANDALTTNGLVPTQTRCVRENKSGPNGEYRNGALTVQILDAVSASLDPTTKLAAQNGGLLWEATVFWHKDGAPCL